MALDKSTLEAGLKNRIKALDATSGNISDKIAEIIADEVDKYIKTATVNVDSLTAVTSSPIPVLVVIPAGTGGTTAPGTVSGTGTGHLS